MWECPDMFELGGQTFLGVSPQGLEHEEYRYQNVYSSGFFRMDDGELKDFIEYDYGFDFYAPQTFVNEYGERILIGWMGIGDIPYTNPTAEKGWQHCLTIPRKLSVTDDGALRQWPVIHHELYGSMEEVRDGEEKKIKLPCDIVAVIESDPYTLKIDGAAISYDGNELVLDLSHGDVGQGRTVRKVKTGKHKNLRIIADRSSLEVFISGGRYVMSTRFYPSDDEVQISAKGGGFIVRDISRMEINGFEREQAYSYR
jgi:beta-fructofuranosidase